MQDAFDGTLTEMWLPVGREILVNFDGVRALSTYDYGNGRVLFAGGSFDLTLIGSSRIALREANFARFDGAAWRSVGGGPASFGSGRLFVNALTTFDDGRGLALYVAGRFDRVGNVPARGLARWDGREWSSIGDILGEGVWAMCVFDDGTGPALYVGGWFRQVGDTLARNLARWDGRTWTDVDGGVGGGSARVHVLAVHNGSLFVGGSFARVGDISAQNVARWDGTSWSDVGGGLTTDRSRPGPYPPSVNAFTEWRGALYAGGAFTLAGVTPVANIASWDGSTWSDPGELASRPPTSPSASALSLGVFGVCDDSLLYAGGTDSPIPGLFTNLARFDGTTWSESGLITRSSRDVVATMLPFNDGRGSRLYAGGAGFHVGSDSRNLNNIARFDGAQWEGLGEIFSDMAVAALAVYASSESVDLFVGGSTVIGRSQNESLAVWQGCTSPELTHVMGGMQSDFGQPVDTWISPLCEECPLTKVCFQAGEPLQLRDDNRDGISNDVWVEYTGIGPIPKITGLTCADDGRHTLMLDPAPEPGQWLKLTLPVRGRNSGRFADLTLWLAHHPGDVNQDGQTNIRDATAFGEEFRNRKDPRLVDLNGDGIVNIRDATAFGDTWYGRGAVTKPWRNSSLPTKP